MTKNRHDKQLPVSLADKDISACHSVYGHESILFEIYCKPIPHLAPIGIEFAIK